MLLLKSHYFLLIFGTLGNSVVHIQEYQAEINSMVAEYEATHPEVRKVQSVKGK